MTTGDEATQVEQATAALAEVNDELMAHSGVVGTFVGLLRDTEGFATQEVGIVVLVDPDSVPTGVGGPVEQRPLPENIAGFRVQARLSAPGPEGT
jgi:hypothetical protein